MKLKFILLIIVVIFSTFYGCDLVTDKPAVAQAPIGDDLIINEIFTLAPDRFDTYSWLEIYNPTDHKIKWFNQEFPALGCAVGAGGMGSKVGNSDVEWDPMNTLFDATLSSVAYYNRDTVFAVGEYNIYRSNDAGTTWFDLHLDTVTSTRMRSVSLLTAYGSIPNPKLIIVCGDSGLLIRSIDRGKTWKKVVLTGQKANLRSSFIMYDQGSQFVCGDTVILRSQNFASTWTSQALPRREQFNSIKFISAVEGRVVGTNGTILYTSTAGNNWIPETTGVTVKLNGLSFISDQGTKRAWAVGDNGTILKTANAGPTTWSVLESGTTRNLNDVNFLDSLRGFVVGDGGLILFTEDGGKSWRTVESGTTSDLLATSFLPPLYRVQNAYALQLYGERRQIFTDFSDPFNIVINPDYFVQAQPDTTEIFLYPTFLPGYIPVAFDLAADPGGFIVVYNDKARFRDHSKLPPEADSHEINFYIAPDTTGFSTGGTIGFYKWKLLPSSEVRLIRVYQKSLNTPPYSAISFTSRTIDIVRFGGYNLAADYPQNKSAVAMPEWWSLARYQDLVNTDLNTFSSDKYFYPTSKPLPGWISQIRSK